MAGLQAVQQAFNSGDKVVSIADLIVLAGNVAVEAGLQAAGCNVQVPFNSGRTDASVEQTDANSFAVLEAKSDGFRNYVPDSLKVTPEEVLLDQAHLLSLSAPELTVLIGGLRVLNVDFNGQGVGVLTDKPGVLDNQYFVNLLDMNTKWQPTAQTYRFAGADRKTGQPKWAATSVDLAFGSNSELRALAEVYACDDGKDKFVRDFVAAWCKVMSLGL